MKDALNSFLSDKGKEDMGSASPAPYEKDMKLAGEDGEDDMEEDGLLSEVKGLLDGATPDQLEQVKQILSGGAGGKMPPPPSGGAGPDLGMPM